MTQFKKTEEPTCESSSYDEEMGLPETRQLLKVDPPDKIEELGGRDIVQFNSFIYYADELEEVFKVDIIRLGTMVGRVAVRYSTQNLSAKASEQYGAIDGVAVFEEGEYTQTIDIPIYDDGVWSSCKEFKVILATPENCRLGMYLHSCRVKILNAEAFPSDDFEDDLKDGEEGIKRISNWELFGQYWKLNFECAGVQFPTIMVMLFDQLSALFLFATLYVGVYIVDTIFATGSDKFAADKRLLLPDRYHTAMLIACWFVIPHVVLLFWDALKVYIDIKGSSREYLLMSRMRTTMDYS